MIVGGVIVATRADGSTENIPLPAAIGGVDRGQSVVFNTTTGNM